MSDTLVLHTAYQQTCCAALRGVSTEPACNLLTHGAASLAALVANYTQFLGMALFFFILSDTRFGRDH